MCLAVASSTFCGNDPDAIGGDYHDGGGKEFCCPADIDENGFVDIGDILVIIAAWGPCETCPEDIDDDGVVALSDVLRALATWDRARDRLRRSRVGVGVGTPHRT